jgi:hypothetical protein
MAVRNSKSSQNHFSFRCYHHHRSRPCPCTHPIEIPAKIMEAYGIPTRSNLKYLIAPSILLVSIQLYWAFSFKHAIHDRFDHGPMDIHKRNTTSQPSFDPLPHLPQDESFGACLMIKEDNDLLYEWLSYHYTMLPLRYVFVGSDEGNGHDPDEVLRRWKAANTGLEYRIVNASSFMHRHGQRNAKDATDRQDAHHSFIHRQKAFITTCVEFMKAKGLHWVTFIDSDEFVVMNRLGKDENLTASPSKEPNAVDPTAYQLRQALPRHDSNMTILETISELKRIQNFSPCYTMPRVLYGALENITCPKSHSVTEIARSNFNYDEMSTLRFHQHARKGDFSQSKYGKVMMDVSNLSDATIAQTPKNIHRPYKPECRPGVVHFPEAVFYLNHYIGSWERYNSRVDNRRNRQEWEQRAYITTATSCEQAIFQWFPRFVETVGEERARFLLGGDRDPKATM